MAACLWPRCPGCGSKSRLIHGAEPSKDRAVVRRRRRCLNVACGREFTTWERGETDCYVIKRSGAREAYSREKVLRCLQGATHKLALTEAQRKDLDALEKGCEAFISRSASSTVPTSKLAEHIAHRLSVIHPVASMRYLSFYPQK